MTIQAGKRGKASPWTHDEFGAAAPFWFVALDTRFIYVRPRIGGGRVGDALGA